MLKKIIATLFGKKNAEKTASVERGTEWMYGAVDSRPAFDEVPTYVWVPGKPVW